MAPIILGRLPEKIETYYEPMVGGGAIFFELARANRFKQAVLSDTNPELVCTWAVIQDQVEDLIRELRKKRYRYDREVYLRIRKERPYDAIKRAARFIYLNKTAFNGLYRVNQNGEFNVPFGRYTDPVICDAVNLRAVSVLLKNVNILLEDFETVIENASPGDAIYFDPPYMPVSETSKFTGYTTSGFSLEDHERLARVFTKLGADNIRVVLSNSVAPKALRLYKDFDMDTVIGSRSIGGPADFRKPAGEIVVFSGPRSSNK